jgi:hypothetical protein
MAGSFFDSFNAALVDLESSFSEDWTFEGGAYPAIAINDLSDSTVRMTGGDFSESTVTLFVRDEIVQQSGVFEGAEITARGKSFTVHSIESQGDACKELTCGPSQIDVWGRQ